MNQLFVNILNEKYNNLLVIEKDKNSAFIKFMAKSSDFGNICIYEEEVGSYLVEVGKFTHSHFDLYDGTEEERIVDATNDKESPAGFSFTDITRFLSFSNLKFNRLANILRQRHNAVG